MADPVRIVGGNSGNNMNEGIQAHVSAWGSLHVMNGDFRCSDMATTSDPNYFGFVSKDGQWYILRLAKSTGQLRYCAGDSGYALSWANKESQTYDYYHNVF